MSPEDCKVQVQIALGKAAKASCSTTALNWLQVASGWELWASPDEEGPGDMPDAPNGFLSLNPISDEQTRITFRIADNGNTIVICDPKFKRPIIGHVETPAIAAQVMMKMLDELEKRGSSS